jgi:hypothetical protein
MLKTLLNMSISFKLLTNLWGRYCVFEQWLGETYKNSQMHKTIQGLRDKIKLYFRYSFLGSLTEIKEEENNVVLEESKVVRYLINSYKKFKLKVISCSGTSRIGSSLGEIIKGLYFFPIKNLSIIIGVAILTNTIFSLLLKKEIELFGWIIRGLVLFVGLSGLFCNATWEDIKKTSSILKIQGQSPSGTVPNGER